MDFIGDGFYHSRGLCALKSHLVILPLKGSDAHPYVFGKLPSLFGIYAVWISTFLERICTIPSTLNTEATPAQRTSHLIPSVEE